MCSSNSQNNLHCNCNGSASNGTAASMCSNSMFARKVPNHSPGQDGKRPAVTLTHLPKRPPVDIEFKNLAYSVSEGRKRGWSSKKQKKRNNVLQEQYAYSNVKVYSVGTLFNIFNNELAERINRYVQAIPFRSRYTLEVQLYSQLKEVS